MNFRFILFAVLVGTALARDLRLAKRGVTITFSAGADASGETNPFPSLGQMMSPLINQLLNGLKTIQEGAKQIADRLQANVTNIKSDINRLSQDLMNATGARAQQIQAQIQDLSQQLNSTLRQKVDNDKSSLNQTKQKLEDAIKTGVSSIINAAREAVTDAQRRLAQSMSDMAENTLQMWARLQNRTEEMTAELKQKLNDTRNKAINDTNKALNASIDAIKALANASSELNATSQQKIAEIAENATRLSAELRNLTQQVLNNSQNKTRDEIAALKNQSLEVLQGLSNGLARLNSTLNEIRNKVSGAVAQNLQSAIDKVDNELNAIKKQIQDIEKLSVTIDGSVSLTVGVNSGTNATNAAPTTAA